MASVITFYNNKGGVSKTTTLFNLAVHLSKNSKKVLIVDCDPQCNATELFFASNDLLSENPDTELPGTSIYDALLPRFNGEISRVDVDKIELVKSSIYENLFLFKGDFNFSLAEGYLSNSISYAITENVHEKNTYISIYRLFQDLIKKHSFDVVLCDVGPSTGAITRMVVLACDGFFLPLIPDRFCNQAVKVLGKILNEWIKKHSEITKTFPAFKLEQFPGTPKFCGAIIQIFKIHGAFKAKASYQKWQDKIKESLVQSLFETNKIPANEKITRENPFIANIRDVSQLAPVAQMFGRAIFDIAKDQTKVASSTGIKFQGVVWDDWKTRMKEYENEMEHIAKVLF